MSFEDKLQAGFYLLAAATVSLWDAFIDDKASLLRSFIHKRDYRLALTIVTTSKKHFSGFYTLLQIFLPSNQFLHPQNRTSNLHIWCTHINILFYIYNWSINFPATALIYIYIIWFFYFTSHLIIHRCVYSVYTLTFPYMTLPITANLYLVLCIFGPSHIYARCIWNSLFFIFLLAILKWFFLLS